MRWGPWLIVLSSVGGCSGGYPLEPTPCDELCHLTQGGACFGGYDPASCVATCERSLYVERCRALFDPLLTCYRSTPDLSARLCDYSAPWEERPCYREEDAHGLCVAYGASMLPPGSR